MSYSTNYGKTQIQIFEFIKSYHEKKAMFPSFEEIRDNFGWSSCSYISRAIKSLEAKGYLKKRAQREYFIYK